MSVGAVNKSTGERIPTAGMPAIDDALDLTSVNPVQNAIITAALADKQNKTDNSLQTTDKTVVGAINEVNSNLSSYEQTNNAALSVPENAGRNVVYATLADLKSYNTTGTWVDNAYTRNGVTFTVNTNASGYITSFVATGTASDNAYFMLAKKVTYKEIMKMTGCPANGSFNTYQICAEDIGFATYRDYGNGINLPTNVELDEIYLIIRPGYVIASGGLTFKPMIRPSYITDNTFVPYVPSVESRLETVESGLTNLDVDIDAPNRKNLLPLSISEIKLRNTDGTWADNVYTLNGITFTINTDAGGNITSVTVTGTATAEATMIIVNSNTAGIKNELNNKTMILSGCPAGGGSTTYSLFGWHVTSSGSNIRDTGAGVQFTGINTSSSWNFALIIANGQDIPSGGLTFYPMLRLSSVSDPTYAPYIPSVESRIEALNTVTSSTAGGFGVFTVGKLVMLNKKDGGTDTDASGNVLYNGEALVLSSDIRPVELVTVLDAYSKKRIQIKTNGNVVLPDDASATNLTLRFTATYLTS